MTVAAPPIIPLESGDRLTRAEFHRRYCARPDIYKAELVCGVVYVTTRVTAAHGSASAALAGWAGYYAAFAPGARAALHVTTLMGRTSEVQPDLILLSESSIGASIRPTRDDYLEGAPALIGEVATSAASYDLYDKKCAYERAGGREYIAWQLLESRIHWFRLIDGEYVRVEPDARGIIESEVFPGLRLDVPKMLAGDTAGVLAALAPRRHRPPR